MTDKKHPLIEAMWEGWMAHLQGGKAMNLNNLPALGESFEGGIFAGIFTRTDGTHCAIVRLPENGTKLTWKKALTWATKQGGELPTRPVAAMLFANVKASLPSGWHWTSEELDASYAWHCYFGYGYQNNFSKSFEGSAVAVRLIPLTA